MKLIGVISGEVKPTEFNILLSATDAEKGSFVKVNHESYGWVLARVDNLKRYLNPNGEETLLAKAYTIGYKQDNQILFPKTPFRPEERVYSADTELIRGVIGLKRSGQDSIYLGLLEGHAIPVYLDIKKSIGKHMLILAKTGAGKSYTVAVIIEELLKNKIPCLIVDPHGEYSSLKYENDDYDAMLQFGVKPRSYERDVTEYAANIIANPSAERLTLKPRFSLEELIEIMPLKLNDNQKSILYNVMRRLESMDYTLQDIINQVKLEESKTKWKVINGLETLRNSGIFEGKPIPPNKLVKEGRASVINLKGVEPNIQELIVTKLAKDLFNASKLREIQPFFFLVEEAHNFCPERGFGDALSSPILRTVASEGRKFDFYLCVVSQRPARVDKNVLSQCNTQIILKVTNPNDLRAIGQSIEGFTPGMEDDIKQLSVGQALVVGECVEQPITVNVRARETKHHGAARIESEMETKDKSIVEKIKPVFIREDDGGEKAKMKIKEDKKPEKKKRGKKKTKFSRLKSLFLRDE
ncbi:MAG: ATP-binding protein [Candidatus Altiarchaeota archaeon]|nr:ATP-binding protein [Candidatus Altiarchaeota archaeon]